MSEKTTLEIKACYACGSRESINTTTGGANWYYNHDNEKNVLCKKCYSNHISNPKTNPKNNPKNNPRWNAYYGPKHMKFKNKTIILDRNPRIGVCNLCRAVVGQMNTQIDRLCRRTNIHHEKYHEEYPLKDTMELCSSCHGKIHA